MINTPDTKDTTKQNSSLIQILIILAVLISIVAIYFITTGSTTKPGPDNKPHNTNILMGKKIGGNFNLIDLDGKDFSSGKLSGIPSLIYFGFTFCPDICPTELQKITNVVDALEKQNININPVFITIDPSRDTADVMKAYLKNFHSKFIGLRGSQEQIKVVADLYGVFYEKADANDNINYMLNHTAFIYYIDKSGKLVRFFDNSTSPEDIVKSIIESL